jgi:acetate kinase
VTGNALVLNAGSSSLKFQLLEPESGDVTARGIVERIGQGEGTARLQADSGSVEWSGPVPDHAAALTAVRDLFGRTGIPLGGGQLRVVGHRVVHGGIRFREPVVIDAAVLQAIRELAVLAPLHNPANAAVIDGALAAFGSVPQVAVFDTAFFATLPAAAASYAIDRDIAEANQVRRFGFHGISHEYVSRRAAAALGRDPGELDQIVLHLGNGASASAIRGGIAVDTSMGLTPLEGLVMGTRGGDIDPGVLLHLQRSARMSTDDLDRLLNRGSGLQGMAGVVDLRDLHTKIETGDPDAALALEVYCHRVRKYIGAYLAVLGKADTLVFTAGVGENDPIVRARVTDGLAGLGIAVDPARNTAPARGPRVISPDTSTVTVMVVPTNEELAIARQASALVA